MRESFLPTRATLACTSPAWWAGEESTAAEIYTETECILYFAVGINWLAVLVLMVIFKPEDKRFIPQASPFSGRTLRALLILWIAEICHHQKCFCDLKGWTRQDTKGLLSACPTEFRLNLNSPEFKPPQIWIRDSSFLLHWCFFISERYLSFKNLRDLRIYIFLILLVVLLNLQVNIQRPVSSDAVLNYHSG